MPRFLRFVYLSNDPQGRPRYPHQIRDGDAAQELTPRLADLGFQYDGVFINWPTQELTDTSLGDLESLHLKESDVLLLTTRLPMHDASGDLHPLRLSRSKVEARVVDVFKRECFEFCSRKRVALSKTLTKRLKDGYQDRSILHFGSYDDASYSKVGGKGLVGVYEPWSKDASAGYVVHVSLEEGWPRLLAVFGMSGTMTLLLAHYLRKNQRILEASLGMPSFTMIEVVRTGPIPKDTDPRRPANFDFCLKWNWQVVGQCALGSVHCG